MTCKICSRLLSPASEYNLRIGNDTHSLRLQICPVCGVAELPDDHPIFDPDRISRMRRKLIPPEGFEGFFAIDLPSHHDAKTAIHVAVYCRKRPPVGEPSMFSRKHMVHPRKLLPLQGGSQKTN